MWWCSWNQIRSQTFIYPGNLLITQMSDLAGLLSNTACGSDRKTTASGRWVSSDVNVSGIDWVWIFDLCFTVGIPFRQTNPLQPVQRHSGGGVRGPGPLQTRPRLLERVERGRLYKSSQLWASNDLKSPLLFLPFDHSGVNFFFQLCREENPSGSLFPRCLRSHLWQPCASWSWSGTSMCTLQKTNKKPLHFNIPIRSWLQTFFSSPASNSTFCPLYPVRR